MGRPKKNSFHFQTTLLYEDHVQQGAALKQLCENRSFWKDKHFQYFGSFSGHYCCKLHKRVQGSVPCAGFGTFPFFPMVLVLNHNTRDLKWNNDYDVKVDFEGPFSSHIHFAVTILTSRFFFQLFFFLCFSRWRQNMSTFDEASNPEVIYIKIKTTGPLK